MSFEINKEYWFEYTYLYKPSKYYHLKEKYSEAKKEGDLDKFFTNNNINIKQEKIPCTCDCHTGKSIHFMACCDKDRMKMIYKIID